MRQDVQRAAGGVRQPACDAGGVGKGRGLPADLCRLQVAQHSLLEHAEGVRLVLKSQLPAASTRCSVTILALTILALALTLTILFRSRSHTYYARSRSRCSLTLTFSLSLSMLSLSLTGIAWSIAGGTALAPGACWTASCQYARDAE